MGTIFDIFVRDKASLGEELSGRDHVSSRSEIDRPDESSIRGLAEIQQNIDYSMATVIQGFSGFQEFTGRMVSLRDELAQIFEDHRKLALSNAVLVQERDHFQEKYHDAAASADRFSKNASELEVRLNDVSRDLQKHQTNLSDLEQRHHLLNLAKKEADELCTETSRQLQSAQDVVEGLRMEVGLLKQRAEADSREISEMAAKLKETLEETILLSNRCENYEFAVRSHEDEAVELKDRIEALSAENKSLSQLALEREDEAAKSRTEFSKLFEKYQTETKERDREIATLKGDKAQMSASLKMLEQVNGDLKLDNEKLTAQIRQLNENGDKSEVTISRLETKNARLSTNLEAALDAKKQIDQSRLAMSTRLDALGQLLRERESENKKLETEVARLAEELEDKTKAHQDVQESLNFKIFELEKEVSTQNNEREFMEAQLAAVKRA